MNDDFLRRVRRPPSATFERQLRARLREQELSETSRRRPSWKLLGITLLIGGSALATATYLTLSRSPTTPSPSTPDAPTTQTPPEPPSAVQNVWLEPNPPIVGVAAEASASAPVPPARGTSPIASARDNARSSTESTSAGVTETTRYISSAGPQISAASRPVRVVVTPDIATLAKDTSPDSRYTGSASFEVDSADAALPTLCAEAEAEQPDIVVTSRRVRREELRSCRNRHDGGVLETTLGHIAIVVTRAKFGMPMQLSTRTLRLALLKTVPSPDNSALLIDNPYTHWHQIDPELEERRIEVLGPARDSPEFVVFAAALLAPDCHNPSSSEEQPCLQLREDGVYAEARYDRNFVRQRLWSDPNVVAIVNYRFYAAHSADLLGSLLRGAAPTRESIVDGSYVGARTLHVYVNRLRHRNIPKVSSFVNEYLRLPAHLNQNVVIPPDGNLDWWRLYGKRPQLTEVKLD